MVLSEIERCISDFWSVHTAELRANGNKTN